MIHRCELRIRRTSGWAWGASPDELIRAATRAIPQLLAARLPDLATPGEDTIVIDRPVTVKITATARQLAALGDATPGTPDVAELRAHIEAEVAAAVAAAIARDGVAPARPSAAEQAEDHPSAAELAREADLMSEDAPRRAARAWWRAGDIDAVLERLEPVALARLHELLLGDAAAPGEPVAAVAALVERAARSYTAAPVTPVECVRRRITLAAAVVDAMPAVASTHLRAAIDRVVPLPSNTASAVAVSARSGDPDTVSPAASPQGELAVRTALPFLLLSSLRHAGWLDMASGLLALHRLENDAFALAAGLAAKVVDPIERGWLRSHADRLAIAAFAGRDEPIADAELAAAAARLSPILATLDRGLRAVITRARRPVPLVLWRDDRGWYLFDGDGMVVLAAGESLAEVVASAPPALVIVPSRFALREVFETLDHGNARFVTDAPPGRDDTWRTFAGTSGRLHTNDWATPAGKLTAMTAHVDPMLALAEELSEVLAVRPAIPRDPLSAFDATCSLAATAALADIGSRLFPAEPTTPVLALCRFRDLDARVMFEEDRIRVRVPLGRRHGDLLSHGILGTLANIPWLAGRTLELGGG